MSSAAQKVRSIETLDQAVEMALSAIKGGTAPIDAVRGIVPQVVLGTEDYKEAVFVAVLTTVHGSLSRERQRRTEEEREAAVIEATRRLEGVIFAQAELLASVFYADVDGVERNLFDLSRAGHQRRAVISDTEEKGARRRKTFHRRAEGLLTEHGVESAVELPRAALVDYVRWAQGVWGE